MSLFLFNSSVKPRVSGGRFSVTVTMRFTCEHEQAKQKVLASVSLLETGFWMGMSKPKYTNNIGELPPKKKGKV